MEQKIARRRERSVNIELTINYVLVTSHPWSWMQGVGVGRGGGGGVQGSVEQKSKGREGSEGCFKFTSWLTAFLFCIYLCCTFIRRL